MTNDNDIGGRTRNFLVGVVFVTLLRNGPSENEWPILIGATAATWIALRLLWRRWRS
jgi:hypothetical protein